MPRLMPLMNNIPQLYPTISDLRLNRIEPRGTNLVISFMTDVPNLIDTPTVTVPIRDCVGEPKRIEVCGYLKGFNGKPSTVKHYLTVQVTPSEQYAASGLTSVGWITIKDTDIPFDYGSKVLWWLPEIDREHERVIAELFMDNDWVDDYDAARSILETLQDNLYDHLGTPTDKMQAANPLEQYKMAVRGESRGQCNNIVEIFVYFCRALGIPARRVNLWQGGIWDQSLVKKHKYNLQTASGHTVAEIYDEDLVQWVLLDPMYGILGFRVDADGRYLTLAELQVMINVPELAKMIRVTTYKPGMVSLNNKFTDEPYFAEYKNYLNHTQRINVVVP